MTDLEIKYQEHNIDDIFRCFVDGFVMPGKKVHKWDANYDPRTGKVIFTLFIKAAPFGESKP